ncbi:hypothetical protein Taro_057006 [Colocasia esculenta]|uniref:Uncharacterized protein n=1 Tax=Colocasia esculenta TaxID=4460 RepID=A0A843XXB6_COLES|nr:hypothetical protein [Colocasia esculenta]
MQPCVDRVEVSIPNWGLAGSFNRRVYGNRCTSTHAPRRKFGPEMEFRETSALSTISECRF